MINACKNHSIPEPISKEAFGGFHVVFRKDIYTQEYPHKLGLDVREKGKITNKEYKKLNNGFNKTAYMELFNIIKRDVSISEGMGKQVKYVLKVMKK
jgi:ATP-dependent DNA helicase RecG